jgi:hypothetical protein
MGYKKDFTVSGGGFINTEGDKLIIKGESGSFGKANKTRVKEKDHYIKKDNKI